MLEDLPIEILQQITGHLPTASAIINLSLTNRKLNDRLAIDDYAIFRQFVQNRFPSIVTPPYWKDAARVLTSRSRAWDRRAFIARECCPPQDDHFWPNRIQPKQKFGYVPIIDSYDSWTTGTSRRQVLAWGAAGRLRLRIDDAGVTSWRTWRMPNDHLAINDILDVHLLKPHQRQLDGNEQIVLRRANNEVVLVEAGTGAAEKIPGSSFPSDPFSQRTRFFMGTDHVDCMDVSCASTPILSLCNTRSIQIFSVNSGEKITRPSNVFQLEQGFDYKHRKRCAKFLSSETLAVSIQGLEGRESSPINIYHVTPHGLVQDSLQPTHQIHGLGGTRSQRQCANAIAPLNATAGAGGSMFLSGWTDGVARLHDLRTPLTPVAEFFDAVDDGQILSLLPIGNERFLAGSHHNACLKTFDLRMVGARAYSYLDAATPRSSQSKEPTRSLSSNEEMRDVQNISSIRRREINIFLSLHIPQVRRLWQPLPRRPDSRLPRYRGSVYSLSTPSNFSPTVFAGIENYVIQLDFASTDDLTERRRNVFHHDLGINNESAADVLNLSCYERPRSGHESTDPILLRKQVDWANATELSNSHRPTADHNEDGKSEPGWDERWRLATYDRQSTSGPGWRTIITASSQ